MLTYLVAIPLLMGLQDPPKIELTPPPSKKEETEKYHLPKVKGMSAEERLKGYELRLRMEKESPFGQLKWRAIGPEIQSGRVVDCDSPKNKPNELLVSFATGGLWRTTNDGETWESLFDRESSFSIGDVAVSDDGMTIWLGTGENNSQRTRYSGTGIYKSIDAGKTWTNMGLHESHDIGRIVVHPKDPNTVYVGVLGHLYSQNNERGVYKTTDGGKTWQQVLKLDDQTGVIDLVMHPKNPNILFAAAWDRDRRAWNIRESGPGSALYKTTDGGKTWRKIVKGLPSGDAMGRTGLALCAAKPNVLYAYVDNYAGDPDTAYLDEKSPSGAITLRRFLTLTVDEILAIDKDKITRFLSAFGPEDQKPDDVYAKLKDKKLEIKDLHAMLKKRNPSAFEQALMGCRVYRSDDEGETWKDVAGQMGSFGGYYFGRITVSPVDPNDVWVLGVPLIRSKDGGKTWADAEGDMHVDHHVLWVDPRNPNKILSGNDGGPYLSLDNGQNWRHLNNLPVGQVTTLGIDNKTPYNVYCGLQDNGTLVGPSNYVAGRSPVNLWKSIGGGDGSAIANDPRDGGDIVYFASQFGSHTALNQKTKDMWNVRAPGLPGQPELRYNWISPIFISTHHPDIIYLGSQFLHRSLNQGKKYEVLSGDLTKNKPNGDVPFSTLTTIAESPFQFGMLYVGADDGTVKMTPNHGATWVDIATPQPDRWVTRIVASKYDKNTVYCTQNGFRNDDFAPYVWKSTNQGKTWESISGNLPNECVNTIREDPTRNDLLYVGTDLGVFVTYDGGKKWEPLNGNLPHLPVHDLLIHERENEIVIGTHARGCWVANLGQVHELTPDLRAKDLFMWSLDSMARSQRWGYDRRSGWDSTPPTKPELRGRFWSKLPGKAVLRIQDKEGKVVKEKTFEATAGFNNYAIDLELTPEKHDPIDVKARNPKTADEKLADPFLANRATYLPVGEYKVELTVGAFTQTLDWKLNDGGDTFMAPRRRRGDEEEGR